MRKSRQVSLLFLTSMALAACDDSKKKNDWNQTNTDVRRCVDNDKKVVVEDSRCTQRYASGGGHYSHPYFWYYGGHGGYYPGNAFSGGSYQATPGRSYIPASAAAAQPGHAGSTSVTRGGFGSTAAAGGSVGE